MRKYLIVPSNNKEDIIMDRLYFNTIDEAHRMYRQARKRKLPKLMAFCEWVIECMEYDQYLMEVAR
jgi:hypothetical protein